MVLHIDSMIVAVLERLLVTAVVATLVGRGVGVDMRDKVEQPCRSMKKCLRNREGLLLHWCRSRWGRNRVHRATRWARNIHNSIERFTLHGVGPGLSSGWVNTCGIHAIREPVARILHDVPTVGAALSMLHARTVACQAIEAKVVPTSLACEVVLTR